MFETLGENIEALDESGFLRTVSEPINKDTEMMPLVRCQFRGLDESQRTAWLFENPTDARGRTYEIPAVISALAPSRDVYRFNLQCETDEEISEKWETALQNPIEPRGIASSPVKDVILEEADLDGPGNGIDKFPIPISTPGFDPAPFMTSSYVVTKDPNTGVVNVGTYRCHFKSSDTFGMCAHPGQDGYIHWQKSRESGEYLESAVIIGAPPPISLVSVQKVPHQESEYAVAGGLRGEPLEVVDCETIDMQVPANAEIIIEGQLTPEGHDEGPFGEFTGYMGKATESPNFEVSCITHRKDPIYQAFLSQMPPSESSLIKKIGYEQDVLQHLKQTSLHDAQDVAFHQASGTQNFLVIQLDKRNKAEPWQAMHAAMGKTHNGHKVCLAVDPDIDPHNLSSVVWAISYRVQPKDDIEIIKGRRSALDPVSAPLDVDVEERAYPDRTGDSAILIDATRPWDYPPTSLPKKEFMERALEIWDDLDLPDLDMIEPWYGVNHGAWSEKNKRLADEATTGEYYQE